MLLSKHPEINENAWSAATTTDARPQTHDARRIYIGVKDGLQNYAKKVFIGIICES